MSSLRRRAIVVQRARSTERSSTGGRVRARTTAAESFGSASARSQAIASLTSGRPKNAADPALRNGTLRSSSAAAISLLSRAEAPVSTQIPSGRLSPDASRCSISRATACASARSLSQRQKRTAPGSPPSLGATADIGRRLAVGGGSQLLDRPDRGPQRPERAAARREFDQLGLREGALEPEGGGFAEASVDAQALIGITGRDHVPAGRDQRQAGHAGTARVLELVHEDPPKPLPQGFTQIWMASQHPAQLEHELVLIEHPQLEHDRVVAIEDLAELDLAQRNLAIGAPAGTTLGGAGAIPQVRRTDPLCLERVDPLEQPGEQSGGVAADLVAPQGQIVEAIEHQREPIRRAGDLEERIDAGLERVLAQ